VLPLVRSELAHRAATGQRGSLQDDHLGALAPTPTPHEGALA
jgi:alkanesulfonate monooxygenase